MRSFQCTVARTLEQIRDSQRVRWAVYGEEEGLLPPSASQNGREIDAHDESDRVTHFNVYDGREPVGTVRLLLPDLEAHATIRGRLGFDLESKFDLHAFVNVDIKPAEVTRFCVLRRFRRTGVTRALFTSLWIESTRRKITHWLAGANTQTDFLEDALLGYRVAEERKLMDRRFRIERHLREPPQTPRRRPCYTEEERRQAYEGRLAGLGLPPRLSLFATSMGARYMGLPAYDDYFKVFALPLVATLADIAAQPCARATRS